MNKKRAKIALHRETLRSLYQPLLAQVEGANSAQFTNCVACSTPTFCGRRCFVTPPSINTGCASCGVSCTGGC